MSLPVYNTDAEQSSRPVMVVALGLAATAAVVFLSGPVSTSLWATQAGPSAITTTRCAQTWYGLKWKCNRAP